GGCETAAKMEIDGRDGLPKNPDDAIKILDNSCTAGNSTACVDLADLFDKDKSHAFFGKKSDVKPDPKKADDYTSKAGVINEGGVGAGAQHRERLRAAGSDVDRVAFLLQEVSHHEPNLVVVVDDEDLAAQVRPEEPAARCRHRVAPASAPHRVEQDDRPDGI